MPDLNELSPQEIAALQKAIEADFAANGVPADEDLDAEVEALNG